MTDPYWYTTHQLEQIHRRSPPGGLHGAKGTPDDRYEGTMTADSERGDAHRGGSDLKTSTGQPGVAGLPVPRFAVWSYGALWAVVDGDKRLGLSLMRHYRIKGSLPRVERVIRDNACGDKMVELGAAEVDRRWTDALIDHTCKAGTVNTARCIYCDEPL